MIVEGIVLPKRPIDAVSDGEAPGIDVLVGTNRDEMKVFTPFDPSQREINQHALTQLFGEKANEVFSTYTAQQRKVPLLTPWEAFLTDYIFRIPALRLAEQQTKHHSSVWMYRFDWPTPVYEGVLGACHIIEIPFVFNTLHEPSGLLPDAGGTPQGLADSMQRAWITFARSGDLTQVAGLPAWPRYESEQRATMLFNTECSVSNDPQAETCKVWEGVI